MTAFLELDDVSKRFGAAAVLTGLGLRLERGAILALLGASGCGKSTLLRLIAGFEAADAGSIALDGRLLAGARSFMPPQRRGIGFVPQDGALFPHLDVGRNIGFGLPRARRTHVVGELLDLIGLAGYAARPPHALSGGQQQRVALARALAVDPALLLLDEPFNALDAALRQDLCRDVRRILKARGTTAVLVTHDREEAFGLADRIAVMSEGRIVQAGAPQEVYAEPATLAAAMLTGPTVRLPGQMRGAQVETPLGLVAAAPGNGAGSGRVVVVIRPEQIIPVSQGGANATVTEAMFLGPLVWLDLAVQSAGDLPPIKACWPAGRSPRVGERVTVGITGTARVFAAA